MNKRTLALALGMLPALWLGGCLTDQSKSAAAEPQSSAQMIAAAKAAQKAAASLDDEWRDTGKIIKAAETALKAGDTAKADKLAAMAEFQGKMGVQQARANANAGNPDYLYQ
jgi:hypothetical protein